MAKAIEFNVFSDEFKSSVVGEDFFVEGVLYISGHVDENPNKWGTFDMASDGCLEDMVNQIKGKEVKTVFKLGVDHDSIRANASYLVPKAKVVDAWIEPNHLGPDGKTHKVVIAKSKVNKSHPEFNFIKGSIEDGFIDAYSIEFQPISTRDTRIGDKEVRILDRIKLGGATLTGRPLNGACRFTDFYCKSMEIELEEEKITEEKTMTEEIKVTPEVKSEVDLAPQLEEKSKEVEEVKSKLTEAEKLLETKSKELEDMKLALETKSKELEEKAKLLEVKSQVAAIDIVPENKALVAPEKAEVELKSMKFEDVLAAKLGIKN